MRPWSIEHARRLITERAAQQRVSLVTLSRVVGRPDGYLGRFVNQGTPAALRDEERRRLATFLGIDPDLLTAWGAMPKRCGAGTRLAES